MSGSMECIPEEIFAMIVELLPHPLSSYSTISRRFQAAIEGHTLAQITLRSTELEAFQSIFSCPSHRSCI